MFVHLYCTIILIMSTTFKNKQRKTTLSLKYYHCDMWHLKEFEFRFYQENNILLFLSEIQTYNPRTTNIMFACTFYHLTHICLQAYIF